MGKPPNFKISQGSYTIVPGPGTYEFRRSLDKSLDTSINWSLEWSKLAGTSFSKSNKLKIHDPRYPGPGDYEAAWEYLVSYRSP